VELIFSERTDSYCQGFKMERKVKMLLLLTWTLFWKLYWLVFFGMVSVPAISCLSDHIKRSPIFKRAPEKEPEQFQAQPNEKQYDDYEADLVILPHLRIWEPETPPIIRTEIKTPESKVKEENIDFPEENVVASFQDQAKVKKDPPGQPAVVRVEPVLWRQEKQKPRYFRKGPHQIAGELADCINEVERNTSTEWEVAKTLRRFIRQHPRLRRLPYAEALQELVWIEDDSVGPAYASEMEMEW
jgi:hypothetical protein